ncbi:MAG: nuclear transport factor 2 family protein, partial [Bacteroidota bacterium]
ELILSFYKEVIGKRNADLAKQIIAEDYIQHNPMLKTGIEGILQAIAFLKNIPIKTPSRSPIRHIICDQDFVVTHLLVEVGNTKQVVIDLFRIAEGKIQEHWDAVETYPAEIKGVESLVEGPSEIVDHYLTQENKRIVLDFIQKGLIENDLRKLKDLAHKEFISHQLNRKVGMTELESFLAKVEALNIKTIHRIIGEGNFVLAQLEGNDGEKSVVSYQLYHLAERKVTDCWTVSQEIPDKMAHENGMI